MIRPIDIRVNAAHPELPLCEATTFTGAPSSVFIRGVPKSVGNWSITTVNVSATYPDNTTTTRAAVESAEGVWVVTIPGTTTSGRTPAGFRITADGIDENGATVTGYVLGFADFSVFSLIPLPTPDAPFYYMRYFESVPASPHKGDVCYMDGVLKWYDGSAWQPIAGAPVVAPSTNPADTGKSADAYATGTALAGKASTADATLTPIYSQTPTFSEWTIKREGVDVSSQVAQPYFEDDPNILLWAVGGSHIVGDDELDITVDAPSDTLTLEWQTYREEDGQMIFFTYTATRVRTDVIIGYQLGSQGDKPLAPKELVDELRDNKANASDLPYAISESIALAVTSGAASTTLDDRTHNVRTVAAPGSGNTTTITATLPPIVQGKSRDMFLNITVGTQASDAGDISLSIVEPSGATVQIDIGIAEDIGIGKNEILITENALPTTSGNVTTTHWLVTVRHEDFTP